MECFLNTYNFSGYLHSRQNRHLRLYCSEWRLQTYINRHFGESRYTSSMRTFAELAHG